MFSFASYLDESHYSLKTYGLKMNLNIHERSPNQSTDNVRRSLILSVHLISVAKLINRGITEIIVSIAKFSIVIGSPHAYLSRKRRAITWVSNYSCPI